MVSEGHGWDGRNKRAITVKDGKGPALDPMPNGNDEEVQVCGEVASRRTRYSPHNEALPATPARCSIDGIVRYRVR